MSDYKYRVEVPSTVKKTDVWEVEAASEEEALHNYTSGSAKFLYEIPGGATCGAPVLTPIDPPKKCCCEICK